MSETRTTIINDSLVISLKKAGRELLGSVAVAAIIAGLGVLADPVAVAGIIKDPSKELLLLIPVVNFAARIALDQIRHRKAV